MEYSKNRILALANGTCEPVSGLEKHFVRVCQGNAKPASNIEREWLEIVQSVSGSFGGASPNQRPDLAAENQRLSGELVSVKAQIEVLKEIGNEKDAGLCSLRKSFEQLKSSLRDVKNIGEAHQTDLVNARSQLAEAKLTEAKLLEAKLAEAKLLEAKLAEAKLAEAKLAEAKLAEAKLLEAKLWDAQLKITTLERSIEQEVQVRLPIATREVLVENIKIREINNKIAKQNLLLVEELRKFIPVRLKCEMCDGVGKWVDKGTVRVGADFDGPNAVDICTNCRGAGFIDNPKREELDIKPMVKH